VGLVVASDDLSRFAAIDGGILTIYDVAASRALGSWRLGDNDFRWMYFATPNVLRVYAQRTASIEATEYDVSTRSARKLGTLGQPAIGLRVSPDGTRAVLTQRGGKALLCDAQTLQPIGPAKWSSRFLLDGRLVDVPGHYLGEIAPGKVLVMSGNKSVDLYDAGTGNVVAHNGDALPLWIEFWSADPRPQPRNPNGYFVKKDGTLTRWNPLSS
jgi:hypothetical protein